MNTQKIQNVKGFTLVELIVVITILVILGTIAFLNLGGMSASARDSQRTSDLNQINQQVMTQQAKSGLSYIAMVDGYANSLSDASIAGATVASGTTYAGGNVGYTILGIDSAKFQDPSSDDAYRMGATTLAGSAYELAAKLEETTTALVMGTYRARTIVGTTTTSTVTASGVITLTAGLGNFKLNDIVKSGASTGSVTAISPDLTRVTVDNPSIAGTNFSLNAIESAGLIASSGSVLSADVVTNGGANLPY